MFSLLTDANFINMDLVSKYSSLRTISKYLGYITTNNKREVCCVSLRQQHIRGHSVCGPSQRETTLPGNKQRHPSLSTGPLSDLRYSRTKGAYRQGNSLSLTVPARTQNDPYTQLPFASSYVISQGQLIGNQSLDFSKNRPSPMLFWTKYTLKQK